MFGPHVKKGNYADYETALQHDINEMKTHGVEQKAAQIFVAGPQSTHINFGDDEAVKFGEYAKGKNIKIVVHNSYVASLWTPTQSRRPFFRMVIEQQLEICDKMMADGFVIHLPNDTVENIISEIKHIHPEKHNTKIFLETKSTKPTSLSYEKTERIDKLFAKIKEDADLKNRVGYCVDTAHLWSSGVSLTESKEAAQWLHELKQCADGYLADNLMFHLNDAENPRGSGHDIHEALAKGRIWEKDQSGLKIVIDFIKHHNLIAILERNRRGLDEDCKLIKDL